MSLVSLIGGLYYIASCLGSIIHLWGHVRRGINEGFGIFPFLWSSESELGVLRDWMGCVGYCLFGFVWGLSCFCWVWGAVVIFVLGLLFVGGVGSGDRVLLL